MKRHALAAVGIALLAAAAIPAGSAFAHNPAARAAARCQTAQEIDAELDAEYAAVTGDPATVASEQALIQSQDNRIDRSFNASCPNPDSGTP